MGLGVRDEPVPAAGPRPAGPPAADRQQAAVRAVPRATAGRQAGTGLAAHPARPGLAAAPPGLGAARRGAVAGPDGHAAGLVGDPARASPCRRRPLRLPEEAAAEPGYRRGADG